jgi:hypothetical protein
MERVSRPNGSVWGAPTTDRFERQADEVAHRVAAENSQHALHADHDIGQVPVCDRGEASIEGSGRQGSPPARIAAARPEGGLDPQPHRQALATSGHTLDERAADLIAPHVDHDLSRIRIHEDGPATAATRRLDAHAFTVGDDILFAPGQYAPQSADGLALLAHEITHSAQQRRGVPVAQRQGPPAPPPPPPPDWLAGVPNVTHVQGQIFEIDIGTEYGRTWVGPYRELAAFLERNGYAAEAHHIVGGEHLEDLAADLPVAYTYNAAPCVALDEQTHAAVTYTMAILQINERASARRGRGILTSREIYELWENTYEDAKLPGLVPIVYNILGRPSAYEIVSGLQTTPRPPLTPQMTSPAAPAEPTLPPSISPSSPAAPAEPSLSPPVSAPSSAAPAEPTLPPSTSPSSAATGGSLGGAAAGLGVAAVLLTGPVASLIEEHARSLAQADVNRQITSAMDQKLKANPTTLGMIITTCFQQPKLAEGPEQFRVADVQLVEGTTVEEARANFRPFALSEESDVILTCHYQWVPPRWADAQPAYW